MVSYRPVPPHKGWVVIAFRTPVISLISLHHVAHLLVGRRDGTSSFNRCHVPPLSIPNPHCRPRRCGYQREGSDAAASVSSAARVEFPAGDCMGDVSIAMIVRVGRFSSNHWSSALSTWSRRRPSAP